MTVLVGNGGAAGGLLAELRAVNVPGTVLAASRAAARNGLTGAVLVRLLDAGEAEKRPGRAPLAARRAAAESAVHLCADGAAPGALLRLAGPGPAGRMGPRQAEAAVRHAVLASAQRRVELAVAQACDAVAEAAASPAWAAVGALASPASFGALVAASWLPAAARPEAVAAAWLTPASAATMAGPGRELGAAGRLGDAVIRWAQAVPDDPQWPAAAGAWAAAGYRPEEAARLFVLPEGHPDRPGADELAAMAGLSS